jgi:hypothetical protein
MSKEYRHLTVERCVKCQNPWVGLGLVCNECRQIEAIENAAKSNQRSNSESYSGSSGQPVYDVSTFGLAMPIVAIGLFIYVNYLLDWIPLKIIWFLITGIVSIIGVFF